MDNEGRSCVYGLRGQTRCLAAITADNEHNTFLVGTQSLLGKNEVHMLDFNEEDFEISSTVFPHNGEIWDLSPCPKKLDVFFTCYKTFTKNNLESKASLWRTGTAEPVVDIKESLEEPPILGKQVTPLPRLEKLFDLEMNGDINKVLWDPRLDMGKIVSINETAIHVWLLNDQMGSAQLSNSIKLSLAGENRLPLTTGTWNPHAPEIAVGQLDSVQGWDLRSRSQTFNIPKAHSILVRALDFNPNKTYQIASGGDDCKVKFWDLRNPTNAIKEISEHSHWVWSVAYNRFHDQLFLSAGSDCQVNLHSIVSFSSAAYNFIDKEDSIKHESDEDDEGDDNEREKTPKPTDGLVRTYDQHEESVYGVAWSPYDAWVFCSLSYDGRAVVNRVPREEKYKILL